MSQVGFDKASCRRMAGAPMEAAAQSSTERAERLYLLAALWMLKRCTVGAAAVETEHQAMSKRLKAAAGSPAMLA